jgi:4-oxalocrotonate tautomerase
MPHVIVKLVSGKSEHQKKRLAEAITKNVTEILNHGDDAVSVSFEEFQKQDWASEVYRPDIKAKWDSLYKKPGYDEKDL